MQCPVFAAITTLITNTILIMPQTTSNPQPNALHEKKQELLNKLQEQCNPAREDLIEQDDTSHVLAPLIQHFNKEYGKNIDQQLSEEGEKQEKLQKLEQEQKKLVDKHDSLPAPLDKRWHIPRRYVFGVGLVAYLFLPLGLLATAIVAGSVTAYIFWHSNNKSDPRTLLRLDINKKSDDIKNVKKQLQKLDKPTPKQQAADILYAEKPQQDILASLQEPSNIDAIIASLDKIDQSPLKGLITDLMLCKEPSALEKTLMRDALLAATQLEPKQSLLSFSPSKTTNYPQLIADLPGQDAHIIQKKQQELQKEKADIQETLVSAEANVTNSQKALKNKDEKIATEKREKHKSVEGTHNKIKELEEKLDSIINSPSSALIGHSDRVENEKTKIKEDIARLTTKLQETSSPHETALAELEKERVPIAEQTKQAKAAYTQAKADLANIDKKIKKGERAILDSAKDVARCKRAMAFVTRAQKDPALNKKLGNVKVPAGDHSLTAAVTETLHHHKKPTKS